MKFVLPFLIFILQKETHKAQWITTQENIFRGRNCHAQRLTNVSDVGKLRIRTLLSAISIIFSRLYLKPIFTALRSALVHETHSPSFKI